MLKADCGLASSRFRPLARSTIAEDVAALIEAIAEAERGETISPEELFARMDKRAKQ
jgi:hypothetical protein